jgi:hypothetical protein
MLHGHSHGTLKPSVSGDLVNELINKKRFDELKMLATGTHSTLSANGKTMDVGIDTHPEFRPYSFEEIQEIMMKRNVAIVDDHRPGSDDKVKPLSQ